MHLRRSFALTTGAVLLAGSGLSACGFDYATDRPYIPGEGTISKSADVDVLSAVVVAEQDDSGTLITTFVNPTTEERAVTGVSGDQVEPQDFSAIDVPADGAVNLADSEGVVLTGDFAQGDMLDLEFEFDNDQGVEMRVPVVRACEEWAGLDASGQQAGDTGAEQGEDHAEDGEDHGGEVDPYSCDHPEDQSAH